MRMRIAIASLGIIVFFVVGLAQGQHAPRIKGYTLTIIEPLPGHTHTFLPASSSVNEPSRAVGYSWHLSSPPLPFEQALTGMPYEWRDGVQTPLTLLPGWPGAYGFGMNARGDIIGTANKVAIDPATGKNRVYQTPTIWSQPRMLPTDLGILPGDDVGAALGINNRGQVVGYCSGPALNHPFVWENGLLTELRRPGTSPNGQARAINDAGEIAGVTGITNVAFQATVWNKDRQPIEIGNLGGPSPLSLAMDINNGGQVVGWSLTDPGAEGIQRAFFWDKGVMLDLGTLGGLHSIAYSVNSSGQVVGIALNALDQSRPFVWEDGRMFDLNDLIIPAPDTVLTSAYHINNRGCISGAAAVRGVTRGFLLTPDR
jgi:probable HAF family extracellular repeat protein